MSACLSLPHRGHLKHIFHVLIYLKANPKRNICFDPQHPSIDERSFAAHDWYDFYWGTNEAISSDAPTPRGNVAATHCFVDVDHVGDRATRRSGTGVLICFNKATIQWYRKQRNTVEKNTLSNEFIALNTVTELVEALWYKLLMFGIPIEVPTNTFCNNESLYKNASTPELTLKKKNVIICYHKCTESVAARVARISKEGAATNLDDLFTKILVRIRRETLLEKFTY